MIAKILLLFFVFSFLFKTDHSFDQDLGRHLKLGEIIISTGQIPSVNLFSFTNPNFPFINTHWLFEVFVYLVDQSIGLQALLIIKIFIILASVWFIFKIIPDKKSVLLLPVGFIFLHVLRERTELRPEIFSFLFTALSIYILDKFEKTKTRLIFLLPIIQLIWINMHIYFIVGFTIQAVYLAHLMYQNLKLRTETIKLKLLMIIFGLSASVSLINPNGLGGLFYPFNVTKNYGYTIVENQTMFLLESINFHDPNFLFVKLSIGIIFAAIIFAIGKKQFEIKNILLPAFGCILALLNVRSFPYLVFLALPATLQNLGFIKNNSLIKVISFIFATLLFWESILYLNGNYYKQKDDGNMPKLSLVESGKNALDFVVNNKLPTPVYNNFDIGSYIIYRGYPNYQVFVDGRPEAYPKEFFSEIYIPSQFDYVKFKELDKKFDFKTIIFSYGDQTPWGKVFLGAVVADQDWKTVYLDDFMIILLKSNIELSNVKPINMDKLDPSHYNFESYISYLKLGYFLGMNGYQKAAQKFAEKGLLLNTQSPFANALFNIQTGKKFFW